MVTEDFIFWPPARTGNQHPPPRVETETIIGHSENSKIAFRFFEKISKYHVCSLFNWQDKTLKQCIKFYFPCSLHKVRTNNRISSICLMFLSFVLNNLVCQDLVSITESPKYRHIHFISPPPLTSCICLSRSSPGEASRTFPRGTCPLHPCISHPGTCPRSTSLEVVFSSVATFSVLLHVLL